LAYIDFLDELVTQLNAEIAERLKPFEDELNPPGRAPWRGPIDR
jgi:hypothetical protein